MTDRYGAFIVVLEKDIREDDAQHTLDAIRQIRGVLRVEPHVSDIGEHIAAARVREELGMKLLDVIRRPG